MGIKMQFNTSCALKIINGTETNVKIPNKYIDKPCSLRKRLSIVKLSLLPKLPYTSNTTSSKILTDYFS